MNNFSVSRRVDELGRIVIPVEIRRILNISEGDSLQFLLHDDNILLKRKVLSESNASLLNIISDNMNDVVDCSYIITDREKVINSNNDQIINKKLDESLYKLFSTYENTVFDNKSLSFDGYDIKSTFYIYPYYCDGNIVGFIIFYNVNNIANYNKLIKFIVSYINAKISYN